MTGVQVVGGDRDGWWLADAAGPLSGRYATRAEAEAARERRCGVQGRAAGEPRYAVKHRREDLGEGLRWERWDVVDLVKERVYDSYATWGMARSTADALNAGRKTPEMTANELWAGFA